MDEKIKNMLTSTDKEMVMLGMIVCLKKGKEWCLENLLFNENSTNCMRHNLKSFSGGVSDGEIIIYLGEYYLHCRKSNDFNIFVRDSKNVHNFSNK